MQAVIIERCDVSEGFIAPLGVGMQAVIIQGCDVSEGCIAPLGVGMQAVIIQGCDVCAFFALRISNMPS